MIDEATKKELKDFIFQAVQTGKRETSGLVSDMMSRIDGEGRREKMLDILDEYFNRGVEEKKFVDMSRLPLVCQDIKNIHVVLTEIKSDMNEAKIDRKVIAENLSDVTTNYKVEKAKMWVAISVLLLLGGTIVTLAIMAIDSKIKDGIAQALSTYETEK